MSDSSKHMNMTKAYAAGLVDGAAWDLDGYGGDAFAASNAVGFDVATIHALGSAACAKAWCVPDEGEEWEQAQCHYSAGVREALLLRAVEVPS